METSLPRISSHFCAFPSRAMPNSRSILSQFVCSSITLLAVRAPDATSPRHVALLPLFCRRQYRFLTRFHAHAGAVQPTDHPAQIPQYQYDFAADDSSSAESITAHTPHASHSLSTSCSALSSVWCAIAHCRSITQSINHSGQSIEQHAILTLSITASHPPAELQLSAVSSNCARATALAHSLRQSTSQSSMEISTSMILDGDYTTH